MCATCGCSLGEPELTELRADGSNVRHARHDAHHHHHAHDHGHSHDHAPRLLQLEQDVLHKNNHLAEHNRAWLARQRVLALNLVSSPGSGKTTLLERTLPALAREAPVSVIEGDQSTLLDAERIRAAGCPVIQVNTGAVCHLDADMVANALHELAPARDSVVLIENVGNLVCPALFDLGEAARVALLSVTEGEDKPLKYPHIFRGCRLMLINKIDLLPYVQFDVERCMGYARQLNPEIEVLQLSATRGDGLDAWLRWIRAQRPRAAATAG